MNHIATARALSLGGELLSPHHGRQQRQWRWWWSRWRWLRGNSPSCRVPKQRLLSPAIGLRWWRRCRTFRGWMSIPLGFSRQKEFIGGRAMSEGTQGAHATWWRGQGVTCATPWCGQPMALLRLCFGLRLRVGKIGGLAFVLSNSENTSCITFLKYKNSRKQELALCHLVNRLVSENV
jgi:hypothetical protein